MAIQTLAVHGIDPQRLMDLSIIGVPDDQQANYPRVEGYPSKFNPDALPQWKKLVESKEFKARCKVWNSLDLAWTNAIQEFLTACSTVGMFPFADNTDIGKNEFVTDFMTRSRIHLVNYFNEIKLFNRIKIRKAYRKYRRSHTGLTVISWADLYYVADSKFEHWLQETPLPRLLKYADNKYQRVIRPNVIVWVKIINQYRIQVGYEIEVPGTINIPGKKTPTKKEVYEYVDNTMFLPIVRAHRISSVKTRLF